VAATGKVRSEFRESVRVRAWRFLFCFAMQIYDGLSCPANVRTYRYRLDAVTGCKWNQ